MPVYGLQEETWSGDFQEWHQNSLWGLRGEDWFGPGSVMMKLFHFNSAFAFKKHFDFLLKGKMNDVNWFSLWICCSTSVTGQLLIVAG